MPSSLLYADKKERLANRLEARLSTPARPFEDSWQAWLDALFPHSISAGFAPHHIALWEWVWSLHRGTRPQPFVAVWPRGGAKSSSAELATVAVGALRTRRYGLYVSETQELADKHVASIADRLESDAIERYYPSLASRKLSKYGASRGWRRNRLSTGAGFTIDSAGLDTATRGIKLEDARPDWIVLDDLDHLHDTFAATEKKIATLTQSLLPAGSVDLAVLGAQNLVHPDSIFSRLAGVSQYPADFLQDRIMSGPLPAIEDLTVEHVDGRAVITGGNPVWQGQDIAACQGFIDTYGLRAFERESQQRVDLARGSKFKREWFDVVDDYPHDARLLRAYDMAATEAKPGKDPDWTAGALVAEKAGVYYVVHYVHERTTPQGNEAVIKQTAETDGRETPVRMEQEPGSSGVNTIDHYARDVLKGYDFKGVRSTGSKEVRANPVSSAAEAGNVKLVRGPWVSAFLDEAVSFPGGAHDDMVDALSLAVAELSKPTEYGWA